MLYLVLKSAACLAVFMLFYKLVLEQLSINQFKRYYLLAALIVSLNIPFITFYNYVEPVSTHFNEPAVEVKTLENLNHMVEPLIEPVNYTETILWFIYAIGVLCFGFNFILNLLKILKQINTNETLKTEDFISVLLRKKTIPHTFFNYIFFNKNDYTQHKIPLEVVLHEQTHAKQKHSIDILFIELLQVVFWFNPLLYFIKKDIKLNHEFLADAAVLTKGYSTKNYQYTLLDYTTRKTHNSLANSINYPTLKKRFKIMKTQSSQKIVLLRTLLIAPLLALLVFSFSQRETVEIENKQITLEIPRPLNDNASKQAKKDYRKTVNDYKLKTVKKDDGTLIKSVVIKEPTKKSKLTSVSTLSDNDYAKEIEEQLNKNKILDHEIETPKTELNVNGISCPTGCKLNFTKNQVKGLILDSPNTTIASYNIKFVGRRSENVKGNQLNGNAKRVLSKSKTGDVIVLFNIKSQNKDDKFNSVTIILVDKTSKEISNSPIVRKGEKSSLPKPKKQKHQKVKKGEKSDIPMPPKPKHPNVKKGEESNIPMPPKPIKSSKISGFEKYMNHDDFKNAKTYYKGKSITKEEALKIFKKDKTIDMITGKGPDGNYKIELAPTSQKK